MRTSRPMPGAGRAPGWSGTGVCGNRCSVGSSRAGLRSRWRVGWRWSQARGSSPMRASTASYTPRWLGRRTMGGDTTFLEPSRSGAGEAAKGAVLPPSWYAAPCLPQSAADRRRGTGRRTLMLFSTYGHAVLTMHERYSRILIALRPPGKASRPIAGGRRCSVRMAPDGDL